MSGGRDREATKEEIDRGMGVVQTVTELYTIEADGRLRMNTVRPSDVRRLWDTASERRRFAALQDGSLRTAAVRGETLRTGRTKAGW